MPLLDHEIARREEGRLLVRPEPLRVQWVFEDLVTADAHRLRCVFACSARALDEKVERRMLEETFLVARPIVARDDLRQHFAPALAAAARQTASQRTASHWLGGEARQAMIEPLRRAGETVAFSCGIELLPPFHLEIESPTVQQQQLEAVQRQLAEQRTAGHIEHLQRATELLQQFQAMRQAAPGIAPSQILDRVSPADRGAMFQTLLLASANQQGQQMLYAVSGLHLVRIDARSDPPRPQLIPLPQDLGPLRSVQPAEVDGRTMLLVGARSGVLLVDPEAPQNARAYADPQTTSALGFNRGLIWNNEIWASHGEAGIVGWQMDNGAAPHAAARPDELAAASPFGAERLAPRDLQVLDESRLIFSSGGRLLSMDPAGAVMQLALEPRSRIIAIIPESRHVAIVHEDGTLCRRDRATLEEVCLERRTGRVSAAAALPWLGSFRPLLAGEDGPVWCLSFDDPLLTQYLSPHRALRMLAAAPDLLAGVSADRQRLILWHSWEGQKPLAEVYLGGLTRHRIADVAFA